MQNDYILTLGDLEEDSQGAENVTNSETLKVENALHEIQELGLQKSARLHLGVPSTQDLEDVKQELIDTVNSLQESNKETYNNQQNTISEIQEQLDKYATLDGDFSFDATPKVGDESLVTEKTVDKKLESYAKSNKVDSKIKEALQVLSQYVQSSDVYTKSQTYAARTIDNMLTDYLRKEDLDSYNLASVGKVNSTMRAHNAELDPHGLNAKLSNALKSYYKKSDVYTKAQTYSRIQLDEIINKLVAEACDGIVDKHNNNIQHLDSQDVITIVKNYANTNLVNPIALHDAIEEVEHECKCNKPIWKTSGPVLTTVGFVEDNTELPPELTLQQILDRIFYGPRISLSADETVGPEEMVDVTMCVHISVPVKSIILYMNGQPIDYFELEEFDEGCITRQYGPITEETEFTFVVDQGDWEGAVLSESVTVGVQYPMFVGIIPKMKAESTLTLKYLKTLVKADGFNNEWLNELPIVHKYKFRDPNFQKLIVGIPTSMNKELDSMTNSIQTFTSEAFNFHRIELTYIFKNQQVHTEYYDFYIYNQPLSSLNSEVTFNFIDRK